MMMLVWTLGKMAIGGLIGYGVGAAVEEYLWKRELVRRGFSHTAVERIAREAWRAK